MPSGHSQNYAISIFIQTPDRLYNLLKLVRLSALRNPI
ncbi:Uncharacterized protein ChrSV_2030 [Chromobacterium vaccinii]|nr:Uncharacterized protein ChrSW_2030 [Chromobacterium vaccinii]QND89488.1 Uncharacterized protein ChrSV_2030 [Chromobacterium vaccinii]